LATARDEAKKEEPMICNEVREINKMTEVRERFDHSKLEFAMSE
jgi:hypothetical protein